MSLPARISVVVLNYRYEHFLAECLLSVVEQKRSPAEIVVMDDASEVDPESIVMSFRPMCEKRGIALRYYRHLKNLGTPGNMNEGLAHVRGDYVMMLGADNYLRTDYLSMTAHVLDLYANVGVVWTNVVAFGPLAFERSQGSTWWRNKKVLWPGGVGTDDQRRHYRVPDLAVLCVWEYFDIPDQGQLREALAQRNFIHGSALFRRSILDEGVRVRELPRAEDWDFWKQIVIKRGQGARLVPEPLLYYRQHSMAQRNVPKAL